MNSYTKKFAFSNLRLLKAPEVYDPGGLTLMIDNFFIKSEVDWQSVGLELMNVIRLIAKEKGAAQFYMVSGAHNNAKCEFLEKIGLKQDMNGNLSHPKLEPNHRLSQHVLYRITKEDYK